MTFYVQMVTCCIWLSRYRWRDGHIRRTHGAVVWTHQPAKWASTQGGRPHVQVGGSTCTRWRLSPQDAPVSLQLNVINVWPSVSKVIL